MQGNIGGWTTWPRCFPVQPSHKAVGMCFSQTQCLQFFTDKIKTSLKHVIRILILFGPYSRRMSFAPPSTSQKGGGEARSVWICDSTTNKPGIRKHASYLLGFPNVSYTNLRPSAPAHNAGPLVLPGYFSSWNTRFSFDPDILCTSFMAAFKSPSP